MPSDSTFQIALPLPLPQWFDYLPPEGHTPGEGDIGKRVRVPFGSRELTGVVAGIGKMTSNGPELRRALHVLDTDPLLQGELLASLRWLARYTHAPLGEVLGTALPVLLRQGEPVPDTRAWAWRLTADGLAGTERLRQGTRTRRFAGLLEQGPRDEDALGAQMDDWRTAARALSKRGLAERVAVPASTLAPSP
ncbi:MAG: primosomal protein N', partial [Pseudoxanthomonas sp.]